MAKVYDLKDKIEIPQDSQVLYLRSYLRNNIIQLSTLRAELVRLKDHAARMQRAQLQVVQDAGSDSSSQE